MMACKPVKSSDSISTDQTASEPDSAPGIAPENAIADESENGFQNGSEYPRLNEDDIALLKSLTPEDEEEEGVTTTYRSSLTYAPDSAFKIVIVTSYNSLGSNGVDHETFVFTPNKKTNGVIGFSHIDGIFKMPDDKYLIIDNSSGKVSSAIYADCRNIYLVTVESEGLKPHPFCKQDSTHGTNPELEGNGLGFCQYMNESTVETNFNPGTLELTYRYVQDNPYDEDTTYFREGTLRYENGIFRTLMNKERRDPAQK